MDANQEAPEAELGREFAQSLTVAAFHRKKLALQSKVGYVQKDKENPHFHYKYASAEAVLKAVNPAMLEARISATPLFSIESRGEKGVVTVCCVLRLTDEETGFSETAAVAFGSGQDSGDKAVMKAQTAAYKYAWMLALCIPTGDDPEADAETDKRASDTTAPAPTPLTRTYTPARQAQTPERASSGTASGPPPAAPALSIVPASEADLLSFPPVPATVEKAIGAPQGKTLNRAEGRIKDFKTATGRYKNGPVAGSETWTRYDVTLDDGKRYSTFNKDVADTASMLAAGDGPVVVYWLPDASGRNRNLEAIDTP